MVVGTGTTEQETERRGHEEEQEEPRVYHTVACSAIGIRGIAILPSEYEGKSRQIQADPESLSPLDRESGGLFSHADDMSSTEFYTIASSMYPSSGRASSSCRKSSDPYRLSFRDATVFRVASSEAILCGILWLARARSFERGGSL
jgi:hypothetical protein